jgi:transcriptional regulator with XRE-family HTH domain
MDYAMRMRLLRVARGWTQGDLADVSGLPNFDLSKVETGKMLPSPEWDRLIRVALGWTPEVDAALDALAAALGLASAGPPHAAENGA